MFNDILMENESLFRNEDVLDFNYIPDKLIHRECEIEEIVSSIKPILNNGKPSNLFIYGNAGIGKTACVKFVFNELSENTEIIPIYLNCWGSKTSHGLSIQLSSKLGLAFPRKGIPTDEVIENIIVKLRNVNGIAICFDEFDKLDEYDLIYSLLENFSKEICIILISNNKEALAMLDPRIISRLCARTLPFRNYTRKEVYDIIKERIKMSLVPGCIGKECIEFISEKTFERNDIRLGLSLIMHSAKIAEKESSRKIKLIHVKKAFKSLGIVRNVEMNENEKEIMKIIEKNNGKTVGEIFAEYKKNNGKLTQRSFRRYLNLLHKKELITLKETGKGFRGRSRIVEVRNA